MRALLLSFALLSVVAACGDDTIPEDLSIREPDHGLPNDFSTPPDSAGMVTLKLENYLNWCSVTVNGGAASTTALQTLSFPAGSVVNLHGDQASATFVWGYWRGTANDTGATHDTGMT